MQDGHPKYRRATAGSNSIVFKALRNIEKNICSLQKSPVLQVV